jgi:hypothetical protein
MLQGTSFALRAFIMSRFTRFGFYLLAATAWLGCDEGMLTDSVMQPALTAGPPSDGGQTPYQNSDGLSFYEYLPPGYQNGGQFPLLVFLHGAGECGSGTLASLKQVLNNGVPDEIENGRIIPAIVISPQALDSDCNWVRNAPAFIEFILQRYGARVDRDRIYITGLSLGGEGTWAYARDHVSTVAAIVSVCARKSGTGYDVLRGKPIWAFHAVGDSVVPSSHTASMLAEATGVAPPYLDNVGSTGYFRPSNWDEWRIGELGPNAGENPMFTVYTGGRHDIWIQAYRNEAMWSWLFAQRLRPLPCDPVVLQQDFQSSTSVGSYVSAAPTSGQFNNISSEARGGTWSINTGRLRLVRPVTTATDTDNDAGITRWTDFPCAPQLLHVAFDLGVSGWTSSVSQSGAMMLAVGAMSGFSDYANGQVAVNTFHSISVKGEGTGQFSVMSGTTKSPLLPANGAMQRISLFLNRSGAAASYRAPDGSLRTLRNNGVALWTNAAAVVVDGAADNGTSSALTDLRIRWTHAVDGAWSLDNVVVRRAFPQ